MKAVIFSCSLKEGKYSTTHAWSMLMVDRFKKAGVKSEIINLRDYDYEATTTGDELHVQLSKLYDADFIIFAAPINLGQTTFTCKNLVDRFTHAFSNSKKNSIDIFSNKVWEYVTFGAHVEGFSQDGTPIVRKYDTFFSEWPNHHGYLRNKLDFMEHLGMDNLAMGTYHPDDPHAPTFDKMQDSVEAIKMCDNIAQGFIDKNVISKLPACSREKFLEMFESKDKNSFGRGLTLADNNLSEESVRKHIEYVEQNVINSGHKLIIFICMKERCLRMGRYDLSRMYYSKQFHIIRRLNTWKDSFGRSIKNKGHCTGNYAPIGY